MKQVDITPYLDKRKGSRITYQTVYLNKPYLGFAGKDGISFVRYTKRGVKKTKSGVRWYFSNQSSIQKAISTVRKRYEIKLKVNGWEKLKLRMYSTTDVGDIPLTKL